MEHKLGKIAVLGMGKMGGILVRAFQKQGLFASSGADFFEAIPLAAPIDAHRIYVYNHPHLYPLAHILEVNIDFPVYFVEDFTGDTNPTGLRERL